MTATTLGTMLTRVELRYIYDAVKNELRNAIESEEWDCVSNRAKRAAELKAMLDRFA